METIAYLALLLGSSFTAGINLYLTVACLGIAHRMEWAILPGELEIIAHPLIIGLAVILVIIEFVADKVPYVDSAWDAVHTAIRPVGGAAIAYLAASEYAPLAQAGAALVGGTLSLDSHLTKASTRVAINASPEPFSNTAASLAEDAAVIGSIWLVIQHPMIIIAIVILFVLLSIWLLPKLFRLFVKIFSYLFGRRQAPEKPATQ